MNEYNPNPQKYVPSLHLKSQLRLRPSVKFQMHILAPSDKRLPMHGLMYVMINEGQVILSALKCTGFLVLSRKNF